MAPQCGVPSKFSLQKFPLWFVSDFTRQNKQTIRRRGWLDFQRTNTGFAFELTSARDQLPMTVVNQTWTFFTGNKHRPNCPFDVGDITVFGCKLKITKRISTKGWVNIMPSLLNNGCSGKRARSGRFTFALNHQNETIGPIFEIHTNGLGWGHDCFD